MELLGNMEKSKKSQYLYVCEKCHFKCCKLFNWNRHLLTSKHKMELNGKERKEQKEQKEQFHVCICGKKYTNASGLWKHKNKGQCNKGQCNVENKASENNITTNNTLIEYLMRENKEIKEMILDIVKNGIINTNTSHNQHNSNNNNNNNTNSHNKAFNLNFFLNETCKNAMNITDFVDSIKLQLCDLIEVGELGYVEGISKIIVKNLNNLDETERPIHCTDKKRETMYIKDDGEWSKEDDKKSKLKKLITSVADKNIKLLPQFREKYPEYNNSSSKISDVHDKLVIEVMETDDDKKNKIIYNISKVTVIKGK